MNVGQRKLLMAGLVSAFVIQTTLVYTDDTRTKFDALSAKAQIGRRVWHENNCYTCHQVYGFGGFLGPDITNFAGKAFDHEDLVEMVTEKLEEGPKQMPVFEFTREQIEGLVAYFEALDKTGIGQARATRVPKAHVVDQALAKVAETQAPAADAATGRALFIAKKCASCHHLLKVNLDVYPDLTRATAKMRDAEIDATLEFGRPERGMLPTGLTTDEREKVIAWFHWLAEIRPALLGALNLGKDQASPWYEFGPSPNIEAR